MKIAITLTLSAFVILGAGCSNAPNTSWPEVNDEPNNPVSTIDKRNWNTYSNRTGMLFEKPSDYTVRLAPDSEGRVALFIGPSTTSVAATLTETRETIEQIIKGYEGEGLSVENKGETNFGSVLLMVQLNGASSPYPVHILEQDTVIGERRYIAEEPGGLHLDGFDLNRWVESIQL
ncbi:TPA: hypothetical protein DEB00_01885, partial [Candidatus Uhrbacteria bacterium]|nr:hypothetical protein [Candidatus Uhrbacteria bacterium]